MKTTDPATFRVVDFAIKNIPQGGEPIDLPGTRGNYQAIYPRDSRAPVVIFRRVEPYDDYAGQWLVTNLVDRDEFADYEHALHMGLLRDPAVRRFVESTAGTVSSLVDPSAERSR